VANVLASGKYDTGEPATWTQGDFTYDGIVDILDVSDFLVTGLFDNGGYLPVPAGSAPVAAVPEPAGVGAVAVACLAIAAGWRSRAAAGRRHP